MRSTFFCLIAGILMAGCTPSRGGSMDATPGSNETESAVAVSNPSSSTAVPSQTAGGSMLPYQNGHFSLQYPGDLVSYENGRPSADGVLAPLKDSIALQGSDFLLTVTAFELAAGTSLADFIDSHAECPEVSSGSGQATTVGNLEGKLYANTLCGLSGNTYFYGVQGNTGHRFTVESAGAFADVQPLIQSILDSFLAADTPPSSGQIEHNGIHLSYDPSLLGVTNIQDVVATADQGMFGQPSPAHTWIGFAPDGVHYEATNHWALSFERQVLLFKLNDFGSFAPADVQAREKVDAFKQLLSERSIVFNDELPILPPINAAQMIQAQVRWLDFDGGAGVRFVTAYSQDTLAVTNDRLLYIFYGMTGDGLHGVTAVFPVTASGLPDTMPPMSEVEFSAFRQNYTDEMRAVTERLNNQPDGDFNPLLSQLDALVQSIAITPGDNDYPVAAVAPQNGQMLADADIFAAPTGETTIGHLAAGDGVVINGRSGNGARVRILCLDGSTGNCWVAARLVQESLVGTPVFAQYGSAVEGQVIQIQAVTENKIYVAPSETAIVIGKLLVGESVDVFAPDESMQWLNVACPRGIGVACWVVADPAINLPISFFGGDGWQDVTSKFVSFRVPMNWQPTAVSPGAGSVLVEWNLGIPGVESDQTAAFFAVPFADLQPSDIKTAHEFEIGGRPGIKWVRGGIGYISYDYYTAGTDGTRTAGAGSFGIHVTVAEADPELEAYMDMLAASITFNELR